MMNEYQMLMDSLQVSVSKHLMKEDFEVVWGNDYFYKLTGYGKDEFETLFQNSCSAYFAEDPQEYARLYQIVQEAYEGGKKGYEAVIHMPKKGGGYSWIRLAGIFTEEIVRDCQVIYTVFNSIDEFVSIQKEQSVTYDKLPGFSARMRIGEDGPHLIHGNQKFMRFFGGMEEKSCFDLLQENLKLNKEVIHAHFEEARQGKPVSFEAVAMDVKGQLSYFQVDGDCVDWNQNEPVYLVLFVDVTDLTRQKEKLHQLAYIDPVTGGRNRNSFAVEAGQAVLNAPPNAYVLVSVDIQKFKVINDLFGIEAGDQTLKYIYKKMEAFLQDGEVAGRLAADTFCLLIKAAERSVLEYRVAMLSEEINQFNKGTDFKYFLVLVAGIYVIDDPSLPMTVIQDRANVARKKVRGVLDSQLYVCSFYSNEDRLCLARETTIENSMQRALRNKEFVVYFQPKQELAGGGVAGAEALVRWQDTERGLIPPDEFIPLFEKNGFIIDLDLYVFDFVCSRMRKWTDMGLMPVPVSVNMSRAHLRHDDFLDRYESIRKKYGIPASLLEIEVTETLVFENPGLLSEVIDKIHSCGYLCSMDDFGSGYSSLNVLKNIRVDVLKLDKAFFSSECIDNPWEAAIISGVVDIARKLQMKTVAEGVETKEQAGFLKQAGCDMLQGYLFSRPMPVEQFEQFVYGKTDSKDW